MPSVRPFGEPSVARVFDAYPADLRAPLLRLRALILETADRTAGVGALIETLKWGQPAYLPATPRTGSTVRIDALAGSDFDFAMLFHCQTTLVAGFRELYPGVLAFEGNRAILLRSGDELPEDALTHCIALALTYHVRRRRG